MQIVATDKLFEVMPTWHAGYDLFIALLGIIIVAHIFLYTSKMYALTYKRTVLIFALAFLLFTIKYITAFIGRYTYYAVELQGASPAIPYAWYSLIIWILGHVYMLVSLLGILGLIFVAFRAKKNINMYLTTLFVVLLFLIAAQSVQFFLITQVILLIILAARVIYNAVKKPRISAMWYTIGVILLLIAAADHFTPWSWHFSFTAEIILSIVGFSCIFLSLREIRMQAKLRDIDG